MAWRFSYAEEASREAPAPAASAAVEQSALASGRCARHAW